MSDQAERLRKLAGGVRAAKAGGALSGGGAQVLAVASGKGGVGKTNVVANVGFALAARGARVLALDADFGLANLDILLNLAPKLNLGHLLRGEATAAEILANAAPGFDVVPGASGIQQLADMDSADRMRVVEGLSLLASGYDFILIDSAAGIGRNVVELCLAAMRVLIVTDPQPTSLTDAYGLAKVLLGREAGVELRLIVNSAKGEEEGRAVAVKLNSVMKRFLSREIEYVGHIARDENVSRATSRQMPFVAAFPRSKAARCVEEIASALLASKGPEHTGSPFWSRLAMGGPP